jgi:hypothetical protein
MISLSKLVKFWYAPHHAKKKQTGETDRRLPGQLARARHSFIYLPHTSVS